MFRFLFPLIFVTVAVAELIPRRSPEVIWTANIDSASQGNECTIYNEDKLLICTTNNGNVFALQPSDGGAVWTHEPMSVTNEPVFSSSGVAFGSNPSIGNYILHAVSEGFARFDPSYCVIYALNPTNGVEFWKSQALDGACSGTPVISEDGLYIFLTHNRLSSGTFTILLSNSDGFPFFSKHDPNQPFSPPGVFYNPREGYYQGGFENRNDLVVWAYRPRIDEVGVGLSSSFAFQFPIGFVGDSDDSLSVHLLNNITWQTISAPKIFNQGYSMNIAVTKSSFRSWNGAFGDTQNRFDKRASNSKQYTRGDPKSQSPFSSLELSSDPFAPWAFGGTATPTFVAFNASLEEMWTVDVNFPIYAEARVAPDDKTVYFVEHNGRVHAIEVDTGNTRWTSSLGGIPTLSNFGQSKKGEFLYFNNQGGIVQAWQIADGPSPTPSQTPSENPNPQSVFPTELPSVSPSNITSDRPSDYPTIQNPIPINMALLPTSSPSRNTTFPTTNPSLAETFSPTDFPASSFLQPTKSPSSKPTSSKVEPESGAVQMLLLWPTLLSFILVLE